MCWLPWVCTRALFSCGRRGLLSRCPLRLLADIPFLRALGLLRVGSAHGIFPDQESNHRVLYTARGFLATGPPLQFSSVAQSCPTLCDPMNLSMPGLPVPHQLPEFTQTQVHRVGDAIQPSHPLSSPSPPAFNLSQHQGLFQ